MLLFIRKNTNLMTCREEIYEFDIFVRIVASVLLSIDQLEVEHESTNDLIWNTSTLLSYLSNVIKRFIQLA